jgi:peptidoglycan-associated lipoprotein
MKIKHLFSNIVLLTALFLASCSSVKISDADSCMERGEYYNAAKAYRKVYNKVKKRELRHLRAESAFKMGECYRHLGQNEAAAGAYRNALRYGYPDSIAVLRLAQSLHGEGKYQAAVKSYEDYLSFRPGDATALSGLAGATASAAIKKNRTRYVVKNARVFNSRRSDFSPMLHGDALYFTTTNEHAKGSLRSEITGQKRSDIWVSRKNEQGKWSAPEPAEGELNTEWDEGIISFSPDGSTMYLTRAVRSASEDTGVEIYTSRRADAQWSAPVKLRIGSDSLSSYAHPAVSPSGEYLYFCSDKPGFGGKDLWRIRLHEPSAHPENLGHDINTSGNEMFPYMLTDSVLLFSSDGHPGLGGLDIFRATLTPRGEWEVYNMGSPINSEGDDFGITYFSPEREAGYFSTNRGDRRGYDHIYSFEMPDIRVTLSGHVYDKEEDPLAAATLRIVGNNGSILKTATRVDGSFSISLQPGVDYVMLAGANGYLNAKQEFTTDSIQEDADYSVDFYLASITKPNIVDNIFYDFDKATLRPESKEALDEIARMLRDNPNISIEMASHTDRRGSDAYNADLSLRRAKSVVDYLIGAGIPSGRLRAKGYGKSQPKLVTKRISRLYPSLPVGQMLDEEYILSLPENLQEVADQINRRTEFQVISVENPMF